MNKKTNMIVLLPILALAMQENIREDVLQDQAVEQPPLDPNLVVPPVAAIELALINVESFPKAFEIIPRFAAIEDTHVDQLVQLFTNLLTSLEAINANPSWIDSARFYGERAAEIKQRRAGERCGHFLHVMNQFSEKFSEIHNGLKNMRQQHDLA